MNKGLYILCVASVCSVIRQASARVLIYRYYRHWRRAGGGGRSHASLNIPVVIATKESVGPSGKYNNFWMYVSHDHNIQKRSHGIQSNLWSDHDLFIRHHDFASLTLQNYCNYNLALLRFCTKPMVTCKLHKAFKILRNVQRMKCSNSSFPYLLRISFILQTFLADSPQMRCASLDVS